jgi:hypothetical protein
MAGVSSLLPEYVKSISVYKCVSLINTNMMVHVAMRF